MRVDDLSVLRRPRAHVAARATVDIGRALTVEVLLVPYMTGVAELRTLDGFEVEAMLVVVTREAQTPAQRARGRVADEALASRGGHDESLVAEGDPRRLIAVEGMWLPARTRGALERLLVGGLMAAPARAVLHRLREVRMASRRVALPAANAHGGVTTLRIRLAHRRFMAILAIRNVYGRSRDRLLRMRPAWLPLSRQEAAAQREQDHAREHDPLEPGGDPV